MIVIHSVKLRYRHGSPDGYTLHYTENGQHKECKIYKVVAIYICDKEKIPFPV